MTLGSITPQVLMMMRRRGAVAITPFCFDRELEGWLAAQLGFKVRPLYVPQAAILPVLTYALTGRTRRRGVRGTMGQATSTYQLTAWTSTYAEGATMGALLYSVLDSYRGPMGSAFVFGAFAGEEVTLINNPVNDSQRGVHQRVLPFEIIHSEPISNPTAARS